MYDYWVDPEKNVTPPKIVVKLHPVEKEFTKKWAVPVIDPALSILNKIFTVSIEDVPSFKDSADRKFKMHFKAFFTLAGPAVQATIALISVFQDHVLTGHLQQPPFLTIQGTWLSI